MPNEAPSPRYIAALFAVATLILVVGSLLKPEPITATEAAPAPPPQSEVRRLYRLSLRTTVDRMTEYFSLVAGDVDPLVVRLAQLGVNGVVWDSRTVVGAATAIRTPATTLVGIASGDNLPALTVAAGPDLPLVGLQLLSAQELTPAVQGGGNLTPGQWLLAAWRNEVEARHTPGNLIGSTFTTCSERSLEEVQTSIALSQLMLGGGVFDIDGRLVAIILDCDDRPIAVSTGSVFGLLHAASSTNGRLWNRLGLKASPLTPAQSQHLGSDAGLLITEIWRGYPADRAALRPGDVILKLGEQPVESSEDLSPLLQPPPEPPGLEVKRGSRTLAITVPLDTPDASTATPEGPVGGLSWDSQTAGFPIEAVQPGSREAAAGIRPGDRLLRIDSAEPRDLSHLRRLLSGKRDEPVFVELQRGDRIVGLLVE